MLRLEWTTSAQYIRFRMLFSAYRKPVSKIKYFLMLETFEKNITYEYFEFLSAYFTFDFVGLASLIFRPYG